jgi:hypothetical protein
MPNLKSTHNIHNSFLDEVRTLYNTNNGTMSSDQKAIIVSDPTKGVKVNASVVAQSFREEIRSKVQKLKEQGIGELLPCLPTAYP